MKIVIALPAYNEEEALPALLESLNKSLSKTNLECTVLVVDDGSKDGTAAVVESHAGSVPVRLFRHEVNKGLGVAILNCFREGIRGMSADDILITMDADNTHSPSLIPEMVKKIESGFDLVIASRYAPGGDEVGLSIRRKLMSRGASTLLKLAFRIPGARDCSCGYRAYRVALLEKAFAVYGNRLVESAGFVCMAEALVKLALIGAKIGEVPLVLRYDLKEGASKMKVGRTVRQYFELVRRKRELVKMAAGGMR